MSTRQARERAEARAAARNVYRETATCRPLTPWELFVTATLRRIVLDRDVVHVTLGSAYFNSALQWKGKDSIGDCETVKLADIFSASVHMGLEGGLNAGANAGVNFTPADVQTMRVEEGTHKRPLWNITLKAF